MNSHKFIARLFELLSRNEINYQINVFVDSENGLVPAEVNIACNDDGDYYLYVSEELPF